MDRGPTNELTSGPHEAVLRWSWALWGHPSRPDGLLCRARYDPSCLFVALFDRVRWHVRAQSDGGLFAPEHRALLAQILDRYAFSLRVDVSDGPDDCLPDVDGTPTNLYTTTPPSPVEKARHRSRPAPHRRPDRVHAADDGPT